MTNRAVLCDTNTMTWTSKEWWRTFLPASQHRPRIAHVCDQQTLPDQDCGYRGAALVSILAVRVRQVLVVRLYKGLDCATTVQ